MHRLLIATLVIALAACGGGNKNDEDATDTPTEGSPDLVDDTPIEPAEDTGIDVPPDDSDDPGLDGEEDGEEDPGMDAEEDGEDAAEDIDDEVSECAAALECLGGCMPTDTGCMSRCTSGIGGTTRRLLGDIITCATTTIEAGRCTVCATGTDTAACWTCLETACSSEVRACIDS